MKDIFSIMNDRRSIRKFTDKKISQDSLEQILKAGFRAPFAAQLCSIVYTSNKEKMKQFKGVGVYQSTQLFMIFFVDYDRMEKIIKARGYENLADDSMSLWLGIQDATLVIENVILAAEALGLGSVLLGAIPQKADLVSEVFNVPQRVFPVVGLCLGYPDLTVETNVRPRYPLKYSAFEDEYKDLNEEEIGECMKAMDEGYLTQGYYIKNRAKVPLPEGQEDTIDFDEYSWSEHISRKHLWQRHDDETLINVIRKHGFNIK